ncbi:MAG: 50S ribosomal protein L25 [Chloroflexi bacterium]|nr:50S ribosomal protein L25 [Chloroflexota bacterium]
MSKQLELVAEERVVLGKQVGRLRRQGIVPANMYGHDLPSVALQVNALSLRKLLARGGNNVISLKVGSEPAVQALIKQVQRNAMTDETTHVDFYRVAATVKLKTYVQLHFVNEARTASLSNVTVLRSLSEVMVECLPADLPDHIEVDLSLLTEVGAVIRAGDLAVSPAVTIVTDHHDLVARLHQQTRPEKAEGAEGKVESAMTTPATPSAGATG